MVNQAREQLFKTWGNLSNTQRLVLITFGISAIILLVVFITWANTPSYAVAFSGLSEADAGQIVEKLTETNVPYQIKGSGTILVPSDKVYEMRLQMAKDGLPQGGNVGLELFSTNTLGMTEFSQRVNYQRAMEGELERTISSLDVIDAVRVHIVTPEKTLLSSDQTPTTASITIREKPSQHLDAAQVSSITHLVASSIEGLKPENVVVVDVNGNLLASGASGEEASAITQTDSHRAAEIAAGRELQAKVQGLLDTALGPNRSVVQANVSMDWTERETTTQAYNPQDATIRSSQYVTEVYTTTGGLIGGIPGASTNLPEVITDSTTSGNETTQYIRNEQTTNYEITQTETKEKIAPGKIERVSLSVLVDGVTDPGQLSSLQTVIATAAGIDETRGDSIAVESLAFDRTYTEQQVADLEASQKNDLYWRLGQIVVAVLLVLIVLWYVMRLLSNLKVNASQAWAPVMKPVADFALSAPTSAPVSNYHRARAQQLEETSESGSQPLLSRRPTPAPLPEPEVPVMSEEDEQVQRLVVRLAEDNPATVAEIIQMWLHEDEK